MKRLSKTYLDKLFRDAIRQRDHWRCQYPECPGLDRILEVSHYLGKGSGGLGVRWDPDNCDLLCSECHRRMGEEPGRPEYAYWKLKQLGAKRFKALLERGRQIGRPSDEDVKAAIKALEAA